MISMIASYNEKLQPQAMQALKREQQVSQELIIPNRTDFFLVTAAIGWHGYSVTVQGSEV